MSGTSLSQWGVFDFFHNRVSELHTKWSKSYHFVIRAWSISKKLIHPLAWFDLSHPGEKKNCIPYTELETQVASSYGLKCELWILIFRGRRISVCLRMNFQVTGYRYPKLPGTELPIMPCKYYKVTLFFSRQLTFDISPVFYKRKKKTLILGRHSHGDSDCLSSMKMKA